MIATSSRLVSGGVVRMVVSPDGRFVAVRTGSSSAAGGPLFAGPVAGPLTQLGSTVGYSFAFSPDSSWLVFIDDHSNTGGAGAETLKLRSMTGSFSATIGQGLEFTSRFSITPVSRYVVFIDQYSYTNRAGRLRAWDLLNGTASTIDPAAYSFQMDPTTGSLAWMVNYTSLITRLGDLRAGTATTTSATTFATQVHENTWHFTQRGANLVFLDSVVTSGGLTTGRLRTRSSSGILSTVAAQAALDSSWFVEESSDGARLVYLTSVSNGAGSAFWAPTVGGPPTSLGSAVGFRRIYAFSSSAIAYLGSYVDGFNTDYGTMTILRAGQSTPQTIAPNVYGRYNTAPNGLVLLFGANFDFALNRGTLMSLDLSTGQSTTVAMNAHEWAEYAPDSSKALYIAEHVTGTSSGRLEVVDLPGATNKRVIASSAQNYRYEFKSPTRISYVANFNGTGDVVLDDATGGAAQVIVPSTNVVKGDVVDSQRQAFTLLTSAAGFSPGTLRVVRISDGAHAVVDSSVSTTVEWATGSRLLYVKNGEVWTTTVTWQ